jgi:hypothetical protein
VDSAAGYRGCWVDINISPRKDPTLNATTVGKHGEHLCLPVRGSSASEVKPSLFSEIDIGIWVVNGRKCGRGSPKAGPAT